MPEKGDAKAKVTNMTTNLGARKDCGRLGVAGQRDQAEVEREQTRYSYVHISTFFQIAI